MCPSEYSETPECVKACNNSEVIFTNDLHYGNIFYAISNYEDEIRAEIFKNGPVVAGIDVYTDFLQYKSGKQLTNSNSTRSTF